MRRTRLQKLEALRRGNDPGMELNSELLMDVAVQEWLGKANHRDALKRLSEAAIMEHQDAWLRDFLARPADGAEALAGAIKANAEGKHELAMEKGLESERTFRRAGNRAGALRAESEGVYALLRMQRGPDCMSSAEAVRRELAPLPYSWLQIQTSLDISACQNMVGRVGVALATSQEALEDARRARYVSLELRAIAFVSEFWVDLGNLHPAWAESEAALEKFWSETPAAVRGQFLLLNLSVAAGREGQAYTAYVFRKEAADVMEDNPNRLLAALSKTRLAAAAAVAGEQDEAALQFAMASNIFADLPQTPANREFRMDAHMARASVLVKQRQTSAAIQILETIRKDVAQMQSPVLLTKYHVTLGEAYISKGRTKDAEAEFAEAIRFDEERRRTLRTPDQQDTALLAIGGAYRGLASALASQGKWVEAFDAWERGRGSLNIVRGEASQRELFIVFAMLPAGVAAWSVDGGKVGGRWLQVTESEMDEQANGFLRACADPRSADAAWRGRARWLYDRLLGPFEAQLKPGRMLAIETDGPVAAIPFSALVDPQGRLLGERFATVITQGLAWYRTRDARGTPVISADAAVVVGADPALRGSMRRAYPPLQEASREAAAVEDRFPRTTVIAGPAATLGGVERAASRAAVFHFAGHGVFNSGSGGLLMAPDTQGEAEVLDGRTLKRQDWSGCDLAFLSACSTAAGELNGPANPQSLVRSFLQAGVRSVIASRWKVDSGATLVFTRAFYSALSQGQTPSAAVQRAAEAVRGNRTSHPYYWAAFETYGYR